MHRGMLRRAVLCALAALLAFLAAACAEGGTAKWPAEPSGKYKSSGKLRVDASGMSEGYFLASVSAKTGKKLKLRVTKAKETLTYDLKGDTDFEVFPLQLGSGKYDITLYENISGKKYSSAGKVSLSVKLDDENGAFLYPNQYVKYTALSAAVDRAKELCAGKSEEEAFRAVCGFMKSGFMYDYIKALSVKAGDLPDIDGCYDKRMGICQDLAAVMCCMLRTQGIHARLMIGYADKSYHAWTLTCVNGEDVFFDPTAAINAISAKVYTVERYY